VTRTSNFGVSRRENHDASDFYARFTLPEITNADDVTPPRQPKPGWFKGNSMQMDEIDDGSVALIVTSPPYFAGKEYEQALGENGVPASYIEYLQMLREVFSECKRKLEPGGRLAVNVANLGRKPYRSLSADVITILQDDLSLLLRGEVIWKKADGAAGNCAWGSFRSAANPVLRDITERIIIASKGRFDRARTTAQRRAEGLPHENNSLTNDEFMESTLDVWEIPPESARRVNHPAPFPIELPERLIHLYTYKNDLVLDPFMGSGTTLVAAARWGRRFAGYDLDSDYVEIAARRVTEELELHKVVHDIAQRKSRPPIAVQEPAADLASDDRDSFQARATQEGKAAQAIAESVLQKSGFTIKKKNDRLRGLGVVVNFVAEDAEGRPWYFDVTGAFTTTRGGLRRTDTVWKCLGRAHVLANQKLRGKEVPPLVFLTSHLPKPKSEGDVALRAAGPDAFFDAIQMLSERDCLRLSDYATGHHRRPLPGFWTDEDVARL
jgi:site-specific DNA-methyltransferase (adenine-specific)